MHISGAALVAGLLAGIGGIGGGMVMSPLLLNYGLKPQSASATSSLTVVFTSLLSLIVALFGGLLGMEEVIWFFILALVGSLIISSYLNYLVKKYKRQSLILFILIGVVSISLAVMVISSLIKFADSPKDYLSFRSLC
jgi:uncharacterized membrane protein YfcA